VKEKNVSKRKKEKPPEQPQKKGGEKRGKKNSPPSRGPLEKNFPGKKRGKKSPFDFALQKELKKGGGEEGSAPLKGRREKKGAAPDGENEMAEEKKEKGARSHEFTKKRREKGFNLLKKVSLRERKEFQKGAGGEKAGTAGKGRSSAKKKEELPSRAGTPQSK